MSAPTPGPWTWREMADRHYNIEGRLGSVALAFDENTSNGAATGVIGDEAEANARLIAAAPDGLAAAELALAWMRNPHENVTERFDRIADEFFRATGFTRPGRSTPPEMGAQDHEAALAAWELWNVARNEKVRLALVAFVARAGGAS